MNPMILDLKEAQKHLADPEGSDPLWMYDEITEDVAELLADSKLPVLELSGVSELPKETAAKLGAFKGLLILDGWKDPEPAAIEELSERSWREDQGLSLDGMVDVTTDQAKVLANWRGDLGLRGIEEIDDQSAKILSDGHSRRIYLDGIRSISSDSFFSLLSGKPQVSLNGIESLPELDLSDSLNEKEFYFARFNKIRNIESSILRFFAERIGERPIELNGLTRLPHDDVDVLSDLCVDIYLNGLKDLTETEALILSKAAEMSVIYLEGLEQLNRAQAEILAKGCGDKHLVLGLEEIDEGVARALFSCEALDEYAGLSMDSLRYISPESAALLAELGGHFSLDGLENISDEAFENLVADYGPKRAAAGIDWIFPDFSLGRLSELTTRQVEALSKSGSSVSFCSSNLTSNTRALLEQMCLRVSARSFWETWKGKECSDLNPPH